MGTTSFYALPYPDATSTVDIPRDIKALADRLELWKNGFTVPTGSVRVGTGTDVTLFSLAVQRFLAPAAIEANLSVFNSAGGQAYLAVNKDGALQWAYTFDQFGQIGTRDPGNVVRPIPFAIATKTVTVVVSAAVNGSVVWTFPPGRFTQTPVVVVTSTNANYHAQAFGISNTQVSIMARHVDNASGSGNIVVQCMAIQMTPTAGEG